MNGTRHGVSTYQDTLRAVGAWLDVRGYRDVRIFETDGALVVEATTGSEANASAAEVLRFDPDRVLRLRQAAFSDRGAPHAPHSQILVPYLCGSND